MPTVPRRRRWAFQAIQYFLRQDHQDRELVIGTPEKLDLGLGPGAAIKQVIVPDSLSLGAKRNLLNQEASSEIIAHWDDDDWYASWRLSEQLAVLEEARLDVSGARVMPFLDVASGEIWEYRFPENLKGAVGATLCYRKAYWAARPFQDRTIGEDTFWCVDNQPDVAAPTRLVCVATVHAGNSCTRQLVAPGYVRRGTIEDVLPARDLLFYKLMG